MDTSSILLLVVAVCSMLLAGELALEFGRGQKRWIWIAAVIGPFAIPLLFLMAGASALRKRVSASAP
jgi:hypothetical protein